MLCEFCLLLHITLHALGEALNSSEQQKLCNYYIILYIHWDVTSNWTVWDAGFLTWVLPRAVECNRLLISLCHIWSSSSRQSAQPSPAVIWAPKQDKYHLLTSEWCGMISNLCVRCLYQRLTASYRHLVTYRTRHNHTKHSQHIKHN